MQDVISIIQTVGFPIACAIAMFMMLKKERDAMKKSMFLYFLAKIMPLTNLSMQMLSTRNRVLLLRLKRVVQ